MFGATVTDLDALATGRYEADALDRSGRECAAATSASFHPEARDGLRRPIVDEHRLARGLAKPTWPGDAPFAVCLTHDVDSIMIEDVRTELRRLAVRARTLPQEPSGRALRGLRSSIVSLGRAVLRRQPRSIPFDEFLELEASFDVRSTFLFLPERTRRPHYSDGGYTYDDVIELGGQRCTVAEMIRDLHRRGWEIGLHGSWTTCHDLDELLFQKDQLEAVLGEEVRSIRQHNLHFDIRRTPRIHARAGLKNDSSLGFNDGIGFRCGTSWPFHLADLASEESLDVLEIPLVLQDKALVKFVAGGRESTAIEVLEATIDAVAEVGGVLTLLFHPERALDNPLYLDLYRRALEAVTHRLAWVATMDMIGRHLRHG